MLIDDAGFGASSAFGGPCSTPTAERPAGEGLKLTLGRFHTTALCSPTPAALLSGRNHHTVGMGGIDVDDAAENRDHLITPDERLQIAMARQ